MTREKNSGFDKKYICVYKKSIIHSSGFCDLSKMMINAFNWTADKVSILRTNDWLVTKVTSLAPTLLKSKDQLGKGHKITQIYYVIKCPQSLVEMLKYICQKTSHKIPIFQIPKAHSVCWSWRWMNSYILIGSNKGRTSSRLVCNTLTRSI